MQPSLRGRLSKAIILIIALGGGLLLNTALLWISGRYGQPTFSFARITGILAAGLLPINALVLLRLPRLPTIAWSCVIALDVLLQAASGMCALQVAMFGFERAVVTAGNAHAWEMLPQHLAAPNGELPLKISAAQLPDFVQQVYRGRQPWCLSDGGNQNGGTVVVYWRDVRVCIGLRVGTPPSIASGYIFTNQLSPKLFLVAFRES